FHVTGVQTCALPIYFENSLPFEIDVTEIVKIGASNTLQVGVRQASLFDVPGKYGKLVYAAGPPFSMNLAGIWQDVYLQARPQLSSEERRVGKEAGVR